MTFDDEIGGKRESNRLGPTLGFESGQIQSVVFNSSYIPTIHTTDTRQPVKNGKLNGITTIWFENGQQKSIANAKDDQKHGEFIIWYENGQIHMQGNFKEDEIDGILTTWYESGQKQAQGNVIDGKRDGKWTAWDENGQKLEEAIYKDDVCLGGGEINSIN